MVRVGSELLFFLLRFSSVHGVVCVLSVGTSMAFDDGLDTQRGVWVCAYMELTAWSIIIISILHDVY